MEKPIKLNWVHELPAEIRCCWPCHDHIQTNEEELQKWINIYRLKYGNHFWYDEQDWEQYNRKQAAEREVEDAHRQRMDALEPIVSLLSTAAGRKLQSVEMRLLHNMDARQTATFAQMMQDVISGMMPVQNP